MSNHEDSVITVTSGQNSGVRMTPLYDKHVAAGARFVTFAGWKMPVQYQGIIAEHLHTRSKASLFDTSHMGEIFVRGKNAAGAVDRLLTGHVSTLDVGQSRYCMMLNESGGILDDLIVFRTREDEYMLVVNAGTRAKDYAWIEQIQTENVVVQDCSADMAKLDLQGPIALDVLDSVLEPMPGGQAVSGLRPFRFAWFRFRDAEVLASRTGYTGERGCELFAGASETIALWDELLAVADVKPAGLGARDTLRLEKGLRLYGHDMDESRTPLEANLSRFVALDKDFIGRERLLQQQKNGVEQLLTGFISESRRSAREGFRVKINGKDVGTVTSGAYSPSLGRSIGLCYVDSQWAGPGQDLVLTDGRREVQAQTVSLPILK